jgi:hypothetical protein
MLRCQTARRLLMAARVVDRLRSRPGSPGNERVILKERIETSSSGTKACATSPPDECATVHTRAPQPGTGSGGHGAPAGSSTSFGWTKLLLELPWYLVACRVARAGNSRSNLQCGIDVPRGKPYASEIAV